MTAFDDIQYASLSDVGVRRSHNQDNHAILLATDEQLWSTRGHVFLVADGMGAHAVGELASKVAVDVIPHNYDKYAAQGTAGALRKAFIEANTSIHTRGQANREFEGMGTTATALVLRPDGAWVAHVGDSRTYRIRNGQIDQLSFDHSMVWEYARRQRVDPETVQGIPSNVIFRSLGPEPLVPVDIEGVHPIREGDTFVLCSDGLSGQISDSEIGAVASTLSPEEACRFLIDLANMRGGPDNITVIIVKVGGSLATPPPPKRPWHEVVPWPLAALGLGTLLAAGGVYLTIVPLMPLAMIVYALALIALVAGMIGLWSHHSREKKRENEEADRPRPKIHRTQSCKVERGLVEQVAKATLGLKEQTKEKNWETDWARFDALHQEAQQLLARGDLAPAFRAFCGAMQMLMSVAHVQRGKGEVFRPVWDKKDNRGNPGGNGRGPLA